MCCVTANYEESARIAFIQALEILLSKTKFRPIKGVWVKRRKGPESIGGSTICDCETTDGQNKAEVTVSKGDNPELLEVHLTKLGGKQTDKRINIDILAE
jgi:hypothetical protein